jgi:uncharacterized protein with PIN domain
MKTTYLDYLNKPNGNPITEIGQLCRKCNTPVIEQVHKPNWKPKPNQSYYFTKWLYCSGCKTVYYLDKFRVFTDSKHGDAAIERLEMIGHKG